MKNLKSLLAMTCCEASRLLEAESHELSRCQRWGLRLHLLVCRACRRYRAQLKFLREVYAAAPDKLLASGFARYGRLSPERAAKIKALLRNAAEQQ